MAYTPGKGATITIAGNAIAQAVSIKAPNASNETVEVTHLTSTWGEYLATIPDGGEVQVTARYDSAGATHATAWTNFQAGTSTAFVITYTDTGTTTIAFSAYITSFDWQVAEVKNVVDVQWTLKVTGAITLTP